MSFHLTGTNFHLEGADLVCSLNDQEGNPKESRFNLDQVLGNEDGMCCLQ
jgi:hypothetical protein